MKATNKNWEMEEVTEKFSIISNQVIFDDRLCNDTKMLFTKMCNNSDDWILKVGSEARTLNIGKTKTAKCMNNLKEYGYVTVSVSGGGKGNAPTYYYVLNQNPPIEDEVDEVKKPVEIPAEPSKEVTPTVEVVTPEPEVEAVEVKYDSLEAEMAAIDKKNAFDPMVYIKPVYNGKSEEILEYVKENMKKYDTVDTGDNFKRAWNGLDRRDFKSANGENWLSAPIHDIR